MTLPVSDIVSALNELCDKIVDNTATMQLIVDELVQSNERAQNDVDNQVREIRETLERQYRDTITSLEERLPKHDGSPIPPGWTNTKPISRGGGIGKSPANPEPL